MEEALIIATVVSLLLATSAADASPHGGSVDCSAAAQQMPAWLAGWARLTPVSAGTDARSLANLGIDAGASATLQPMPAVTFAVAPEKAGTKASHGGMFVVAVPVKARYRVALGAPAWIDVLTGTTPVVAAAHGHGPVCSGVRKMVDFDLEPGRYVIQISGSDVVSMPIMITRAP